MFSAKTIEIQRQFTPILINGRKCTIWLNLVKSLSVFDVMQRHENRSAADLKQCMVVRQCVRLEPASLSRVALKYR